jgi:hypothetical protein
METLIELKAAAYDALVQAEMWKKKVIELEQAIINYKEPEPEGSDLEVIK